MTFNQNELEAILYLNPEIILFSMNICYYLINWYHVYNSCQIQDQCEAGNVFYFLGCESTFGKERICLEEKPVIEERLRKTKACGRHRESRRVYALSLYEAELRAPMSCYSRILDLRIFFSEAILLIKNGLRLCA